MIYKATTSSAAESMALGERLAQLLAGGEVLELASDLGGGKTTFMKGVAKGLGYAGEVISPTFTVSRIYELPGKGQLHHFDFYRLAPGDVTAQELAEVAGQPDRIVAIEWAGNVGTHLPADRLRIEFEATGEQDRSITFSGKGQYTKILKELQP